MEKEKIQLPYKIILKKLWGNSYFGNIGIKKFRNVLSISFRMGKENWKGIYEEMKCLGYISYKGSKRAGLQIEVPMKDLV